MGVAVDRMRKARGQKVVLSCSSVEDAKKIEERLKIRGADLKVAKPEMRLPTVIIRDVLRVNSDEDIVRSLRTQNRHLSEGLDWDKVRARVCYRRRARNDLECHPVLEVSPELYHRLIKAGFVYVGLQRRPVWDQSPLVQCSRCLGYGHGKRYCKEVSERCAHCGGEHTGVTCRARKDGEPPKMRGVLLAAGALAAEDRTHTAEGSSTEGCTDRVSLRFMQSNLQRSKLATTELLVEAARRKIAVAIVQEPYIGNIGELRRYPGCRVVQKTAPRRGPVKAAIMVLSSDVDVEEDQTLNGENVAAAVIKAGNCRIGVVSVYFEGDMPIGPERNDARGVDLCDFLDSEGLHILNEGNTPTFEVYRGDRLLKSVVDVTVQPALLDRAEGWQVVRDVTSSDHNAVTFAVRVEGRSGPRPLVHESTIRQRLDGPSSQQPWMLLLMNGL
ncbi:hypothetical protein EVAR_598_1 [Eumeta japonica]|uniref:115 kDa protein in type-1 retrotransposable element R1DM n=1 Tax=Eumeta variegata TaxID=151549 RepID=A0A4C1SBA0_EUMVA|nr:hypothetical protein EVAR_598_1 [Eumeta japonica]